LQGNEFSLRAFWQAADGQMFFGGTNGLTAFYPEQISDNPYHPPLVLTDFQLFNKPVQPGQNSPLARPIWATDHLTLNHDQDIFSFEFAALSYATPHKSRYRYKLEGFEEEWNEVASDRRFATYTNLPAGEYIFRVQGTNDSGLWSDQEATLNLTVLPPWWETSWFRVGGLIGLVGLAYGLYRRRVHAIQKQNRLLELQVTVRTQELTERTEDLAHSYALLEQEIVERKRTEEQLQQAKEAAEAANRAKSAFLANMSHELRSPLNAILGFAQIIRRNQELPHEVNENLGIILRSGEHLLTLINQVLDLSKIEVGRISLNESDFDLYDLLNDLEDMFSLKADDKQLQLIFDHSNDLPRYIRTDEVKLRQVLINLLNNALKFTETGGVTLRVKSEEIGSKEYEVRSSKGNDNDSLLPTPYSLLHFEVEDTGPGIAPEEMGRLFEAFTQTETGRQAGEGTGLGLAISRKFIQLMGGDITVKSQIGQGTIFTFNLQCQVIASIENRESPGQLTAGKIPWPPFGRRQGRQNRMITLEPGQPCFRILVVDDQWTNRHLLIQLLNPLGFDLREAENGQQAIEIWEEFEPHLIWMDMRMPVMDGFEATKRIKATTKGQATAIIALTASSFEEERAIVLSAGCDDFVRKPFRETDIFEMMRKHIGLRYVYKTGIAGQDTDIPLPVLLENSKPALDTLPPGLLAQLTEGAELGDMEMIAQVIAEIHHHHPSLAEGLAHLARNFEYDKILVLTQGAAE
jgi:signal transduction histidine kinase/response regulator of citrate/malate metabolism